MRHPYQFTTRMFAANWISNISWIIYKKWYFRNVNGGCIKKLIPESITWRKSHSDNISSICHAFITRERHLYKRKPPLCCSFKNSLEIFSKALNSDLDLEIIVNTIFNIMPLHKAHHCFVFELFSLSNFHNT